jgi:DNA processing protein
LLLEISSPPPVVFTIGDPATLLTNQIAVVGSRNPSPAGERTARDFAEALAAAGLTVTSGLAIGIDAAAHRGSLNGGGRTLAVVGTGLDQVYPRRHEALAEEIAGSGAVVSEFPLGTPPRPSHFPRRNRIISGLSIGTLVVEASLRSGSLITAKAALDQGREVFAIPGSIHSAMARGCHSLIKQGAKLVESVDDVLEELGGFGLIPSRTGQPDPVGRTPDAAPGQLLKYVAWEPTSVDTLVRASGMNAETVSYLLLTLELEGYVASTPTGCYCRIA